MCCTNPLCVCSLKNPANIYSGQTNHKPSLFSSPNIFKTQSPYFLPFQSPVMTAQCNCQENKPIFKLKEPVVNNTNSSKISQVSWGETKGMYPTKDNLYNPAKWDSDKTLELLKCRAAFHLVVTRGEKHHTGLPNLNNNIEARLAPYHLTSNFPEVDSEIKDEGVKWFFLASKAGAKHTALNDTQVLVKSYGPLWSNGGGDNADTKAPGYYYWMFYKAKKK
jgi:hypothetical protein